MAYLTDDKTLSSILGCPPMSDAIMDAADEIQRNLEQQGWPRNIHVMGLCMLALEKCYTAGERRGVLRERSEFASLYPIHD